MKMWEESVNMIMILIFLIVIYAFTKTHIMNNLIMIEFMVVSLLILMFSSMVMMKTEIYLILYFIISSICESIIGLSMLIAMIRTHSNDFIKSINLLKF